MPYVQHTSYSTVTPFSALVDWPLDGKHGCILDWLQISPLLGTLEAYCYHYCSISSPILVSLCISLHITKENREKSSKRFLLFTVLIAQFYTQNILVNTEVHFPTCIHLFCLQDTLPSLLRSLGPVLLWCVPILQKCECESHNHVTGDNCADLEVHWCSPHHLVIFIGYSLLFKSHVSHPHLS